MNDMARIVQSGEGQSVELPEWYRFEGAEVRVWRDGDRVVLEPAGADERVDPETGLMMHDLDRRVQEGLDSGPDEPWDVEEIKREGRKLLEERRR